MFVGSVRHNTRRAVKHIKASAFGLSFHFVCVPGADQQKDAQLQLLASSTAQPSGKTTQANHSNDSAGPAHRTHQPIGEHTATAWPSPLDHSSNQSAEQDSAELLYRLKHQSASSALERCGQYILSPYRFLTACLELLLLGSTRKVQD
ncbi:hypothetical protein E1301_Tti023567 [Triplophysa tibetana]|uniref:Uncharacterized protein n=1 Tax=Triplophysa tibetana TaxID=1572043 RepID=A0A5A9NA68_9TELE|nr:hypothetical protein E1301_Tti023567 [Triplophysa tibetana]